jgi:hypothetical protein
MSDFFQDGNRNYSGNNYSGGNYSGNTSGYKSGFNKGGFNKGNFNRPKEPLKPEDIRFYQAYAITGNKDIPHDIRDRMLNVVRKLESKGFICRTGGMEGIEDMAEKCIKDPRNLELHLPWKNFADKESKFTFTSDLVKELAKKFHPAWDSLKLPIQGFLAKNARIVLGKDAHSHCMFLMVWTQDGAEKAVERTAQTGSAGHAIAIANRMNIPVFNFAKPDAESRLFAYIPSESNHGQSTTNQETTNVSNNDWS